MKKQKNLVRIISVTLTLTLLVQVGAVGLVSAAPGEKPEVTEREIKTFYDGESLISEEITGLREESVKHFRLENGQNNAVIYSAPVNYLDSDGEWKEIDNSLVLNDESSDNPFYTLKASDVDLRLPESIGKNEKIHIAKNDIPFEMGPISEGNNKSENAVINNDIECDINYDENASAIEKSNAERIQSAITSSEIEYKNAFDSTDLEYTISSSGIKEDIVINEPRDNYSYSFELDYGSLIPVSQDDGSIGFYASEEDEEAVYTLSAPYMYDAEGEYSEDVELSLDGNLLTVNASEKWINKHGRVFPVTIDPSVTISSSSFQDSHVRKVQNNTNYGSNASLYSGKTLTSMRRTYIKFTLPSLPDNAVIMNANLKITQDNTPDNFDDDCKYLYLFDLTGYSSWTESGIKWNNQPLSTTQNGPQTNGTPVVASVVGNNSSNHLYTFSITDVLKGWYKNNNNNGFMISTNNENKNGQACFYSSEASSNKPYAVITYTENIGMREYWPYQTIGMDEAGTAYVNTHNGSLYYSHSDASTSGLVLPVGVSHFYAGPQDFLTGDVYNMKFGKGFTLNLIEKLNYSNSVYTDSYGNVHNIAYGQVEGVYKNYIEDEPSTKVVSLSGGGARIDYLDGSSKTFNSSGYLISVKDKNLNTIQITYSGGRITQVKSGANQTVTFSYNSSNFLTSITDNAGRVTQFTYNSNGYLTQITNPDSTCAIFSYSSGYLYEVKNAAGARMRFTPETVTYGTNSFCRVKSITSYGENNSSSYSDKIDFTYNGYTTVVENNHNDSLTVEFDISGRAVSYSSKGNTSRLMYNNGGLTNNTVSSKSNSFAAKTNLVSKNAQRVSTWSGYGSSYTATSSSERVYNYSTSKKIVGTNVNAEFTPNNTNYVRVSPGQSYTAMINVNIDGTASYGNVYLKVTCGNETVQSPAINTTGDSWMPLYASITVPSGVTTLYISLVLEYFTGTVYADMASVTEGASASLCNMIPDSDFAERSRYGSSAWAVNGYVDYTSHYVKVYGEIVSNSAATQTFPLIGSAGEQFTFGFSAQSISIPMQNTYFYGAKVVFVSGGNDVSIVSLPLEIYSSDWQYIIASVSSSASFDSVRIEFRNDMMLKDAVFKDVFLYKGTSFGYNYTYNNNKFVTGVSDGAGNSKLITYIGPDISNIQQISNGVTQENVEYTYDSNHNILTAEDNITGITTSYTYPASNNKGLPVSSTVTSSDNLTATTSYGYTSNYNYLTSITDPSGAVTQYDYNTAKGLVTKVTDPNGNETNCSYNSKDLLSSIYADVGNDVAQVNYQYDSINRLTNISNSDISYGFTYDLFGRSDTITSSGNTLTDLTYNSDSTVSRVDSAGSNYSTYTYDDRDRVTSESYNGNLIYTYKYNDNNALTEVYYAENNVTESYLYDQLGRTIGTTSSDGKSSAYVYDAQSRLTRTVITDNNTTVNNQTFSYDSQNRITGTGFNTIGKSISYSYDGLNRPTTVASTLSGNGTLSKIYSYKTNGTNETGQINSINYKKTINGTTTLIYPALSYEYDNNGNITRAIEGSTTLAKYYYDELNRLIREDNAYNAETIVYNYDVNGDILSKDIYYYTTSSTLPDMPVESVTYSYTNTAWKNAVTQYDGQNIVYNSAGNPTSYRGHTMTWNRNRLMSSRYNNYNITYAYGADGLRTEKHTGDDNFTYYYSGGKLVKLTSGSLTMKIYYGADGSPYAFDYGGTLYYYILNLQGDVIGLCDENAIVVVDYIYDAWGKVTRYYSAGYSYLSRYNPLRYRGYVYDEETGLYYLQNRYYDPETGRFISADAYLVAGDHINSTNMFAYCLNNPVIYIDPSGRIIEIDTSNPITALFGLVMCTYICLDSKEGLGMSIDEYLYYLYQCYSLGDAVYISLVMLNGKYEGKAPHKINGHTVIGGNTFETCKSFTNKEVCLIVAKYYTWVEGGTSEINIAQEIYFHAMMYYYYDNLKSLLGDSLADGINVSATTTTLGENPIGYGTAFNIVWYLDEFERIWVVTAY